MKLFYRFSRAFFKVIYRTFYTHRVYGVENLPKGATLLAPNHNSFFDPPVVGISCPEEIHFLARDTLFHNTLLGAIISRLNTHPVTRGGFDLHAFKEIARLLSSGHKVVLFPEGQRSPNGKLQPIKGGAALLAMRTNTPIVPIYLQGTFDIWPKGRSFPKIGGKTLCAFGKPIYPDSFVTSDKKLRQEEMSEALQRALVDLQERFTH